MRTRITTRITTLITKGALLFVLAVTGLGLALPASAEEAAAPAEQNGKGTILHPKVDKPIPDTYEPLGGTRWEDRDEGTDEIKDSWKLKKAEEERERARHEKAAEEQKSAPPLQKDIKIQEVVPEARPAGGAKPAPKVEKDKDSLQIHDQ